MCTWPPCFQPTLGKEIPTKKRLGIFVNELGKHEHENKQKDNNRTAWVLREMCIVTQQRRKNESEKCRSVHKLPEQTYNYRKVKMVSSSLHPLSLACVFGLVFIRSFGRLCGVQ